MRKEKNFRLDSIEDVKSFAYEINGDFYYIDDDGECWKGNDLRMAICNSSYDYDVWLGQMKEVMPYEFYYIEESEIEYKRMSIIYYDSDNPIYCESEEEAISCCFGEFEHLHAYDKQKSIVSACKCFGVPEYIECSNDSEIVGFALRYNRKNYFCNCSESPDIVFRIDRDLENLNVHNVFIEDNDYSYCDSIDGVTYKAKVDNQHFKEFGEIWLDENIYISK